MADKKYRMRLSLSDGLAWFLDFIAPQGPKGEKGDEGFSPVVTVEDIEGGHKITVTDASGAKEFIVLDGEDGEDGVGVVAIEQTTTSDEDGGSNVITAILSDGTKSTFTVKNGRKGSQGDAGNGIKAAVLNSDYTLTLTFDDDTTYTTPSIRGVGGKSAYEYAQEAGYTGTEEEWAEMIASGGVHIGPEAPEDENIKVWIDTDEEAAELDGTAAVGQIFMVTEVDADGKPTKWQAVDLPKGETPDWNANEGEAGHILERTHYVDAKGVIHKLPNMFIDADWMATKQEGGAGKTVFIPEQTVSNGLWENLQADLVEGTAYAVEVNGVLYKCVCKVFDEQPYLGNGSLWGDTATAHNNEPFAIVQGLLGATTGTLYTDGTLSDPIGIKVTNWLDTVYNTLPEEFLPDNVLKGEGGMLGWDKVSGKPFSQDAGELLYEAASTFATDDAATSGVRTTNLIGKWEDGAEFWLEVNGDMFKCYCKATDTTYELYDAAGNRWIKKQAVFMYVYAQTAGTYTYKLYDATGDVVLDPQRIPKNIARKYDIPDAVVNPATASVGQTIIVEEVDESGKPTKWRAADYQPRTHWEYTEGWLAETTVELGDEGTGEFTIEALPNVGDTFVVMWNGAEYRNAVVAVEGVVMVGNSAQMTGTGDTGEPFGLAFIEDDGLICMVVAFDGTTSTSVTMSIQSVVVAPIPAPYLTNAFPYYIDVTTTTAEDGTETLSIKETAAELQALYASGRQMIARKSERDETNGYTGTIHLFLASIYAFDTGGMTLLFHLKIGSASLQLVVINVAADGTVSVTDNLG